MASHEAGIGEGVITKAPDIIFVRALGSCIAIIIYDPKMKIGGLAHVMLPDSSNAKNGYSPYQYADTAIDSLTENACRQGANKFRLKAKAVGGAQLFDLDDTLEKPIGEQNIAMVRKALTRAGISLVAEDMGGRRGRNIKFYLDSGRVQVTTIGQQPRDI